MYRLSLKLNLNNIHKQQKRKREKKKCIPREQWQSMHQCNVLPKLMSNAAPNLKWWYLSLLQMVSLFQAQAQA
jgi:hypothetical protein